MAKHTPAMGPDCPITHLRPNSLALSAAASGPGLHLLHDLGHAIDDESVIRVLTSERRRRGGLEARGGVEGAQSQW